MSLFTAIKYPITDMNSLLRIQIPKKMWNKFYEHPECNCPLMPHQKITELLKKVILEWEDEYD